MLALDACAGHRGVRIRRWPLDRAPPPSRRRGHRRSRRRDRRHRRLRRRPLLVRDGATRGRVPPRRLERRRRLLERTGAGRSESTPTAPSTSCGRRRPPACSECSLVSSADVYGIVDEADLPITEDHPLRPVSPYAASKVAADFLGLQAWLGHGLEVLRVRAFNHLGPGQSPHFVAPSIASRIAQNEQNGTDEILVGNLEARRDLTDVRDVVRAYRLLVDARRAGRGLQRVLGSRRCASPTSPPHCSSGRNGRCGSSSILPGTARSTSPCSAARTTACAPRRGGGPRSRSTRRSTTSSPSGANGLRPASVRLRCEQPAAGGGDGDDLALVGGAGEGGEKREPLLGEPPHAGVVAVGPVEPGQVAVEQRQLELDLGVARRRTRQPLGLGDRIVGAGDELRRVDLEHAGEEHDGALARDRHACFEVRHRDTGDGDAVGELLLGPSERGAMSGEASSQVLGHVPTCFADAGTGAR